MGLLVRRLSTGLGYPAVVSIRTGHRSNSSNAPSASACTVRRAGYRALLPPMSHCHAIAWITGPRRIRPCTTSSSLPVDVVTVADLFVAVLSVCWSASPGCRLPPCYFPLQVFLIAAPESTYLYVNYLPRLTQHAWTIHATSSLTSRHWLRKLTGLIGPRAHRTSIALAVNQTACRIRASMLPLYCKQQGTDIYSPASRRKETPTARRWSTSQATHADWSDAHVFPHQ